LNIPPSPRSSGICGMVSSPINPVSRKTAADDMPELKFISSEEVSAEKLTAQWLINEAPINELWMIGVIGNANPAESLRISQPPGLCAFGEASGGFEFNLGIVKEAVKLIGDTPWKKDVAPAIHAYEEKLRASVSQDTFRITKANEKLDKLFKKN